MKASASARPPVITEQTYGQLAPSMRAALALLVFNQRSVRTGALTQLLRTKFATITANTAQGMLQQLASRGMVTPLSGSKWSLRARFTCAAVRAMAREADAQLWWPRSNAISSAFSEPDYYGFYSNRKIDAEFQKHLGEGIRHVAAGFAEEPTILFLEELRGNRGTALAHAVAMASCEVLADAPAFTLRRDDPLLPLCGPWLNVAFVEGRDVRPMADALARLLADGGKLPNALMRCYAATCAWLGRGERLADKALPGADCVVQGCRAVAAGDLVAAEKMFRKFEEQCDGRALEENLDNFPVRVLGAMAMACVKPEKIAKLHPSRLLESGLRHVSSVVAPHPRCTDYMRAIRDTSVSLGDGWKDIVAGRGLWIAKLEPGAPCDLIYALNHAWDYRQLATGRAAARAKGQALLSLAVDLAERGWKTVGRLMASLLTGCYDSLGMKSFLDDVEAKGFLLLPKTEPEPEWKAVLRTLRKITSKSERDAIRAEDAPATKLVWRLSLSEMSDGCYDIDYLGAAVRPEGDEDGSRDNLIALHQLKNKGVQKLMSERDQLVAKTLQAGGGYYYYDDDPSDAAMRDATLLLCGMPNVCCAKRVRYADRVGKAVPITLEKRRCELETTVGEDGGVVLKVPTWAYDAVGDWTLRKIDAHRFACVEVPSEARKLLEAFRQFGSQGRLVLPREAMAEAEGVLNGLAAVMPVAEPSAENAASLRRVPAASDVRVRLDFTEGVLTVRAVVLPVPENRNLMLEPGTGLAEKIVTAVAGSYVLVRDLAAEKAHFEPVRAALADGEAWFDGAATWRYGDLAAGIAALAALKALGTVPVEWANDRTLRVTNAPASGVKLSSSRTADEWFRVDGEFALDDGRILSIVELLEASRDRVGNYVKLSDGDYVALTKEMTRELDALRAAGRRKGSSVEIVKAAIPMLDGVFGEGEGEVALPDAMAVTAKEIREAFAKRPRPPATLNAELRPYQEEGYKWLSRLAACGFGACLADDMGLGKTIQVICLLLERRANGPSLVIAPSSVCGNWRRELERFAPTLAPVMAFEGADLASAKPGDVVIASYGYLLFHAAEFQPVTWNGLVLDEAQAIKNDASKRAKTVKNLHAKFRVAATGTPVENRLGELWSLFDFLNPGLLGPAASFAQRFTEANGKASAGLKRLVKPLILRRLKGDVLDDLPEKTEITIPVELGTAERTAYEACRRHALAQLAAKAEDEGGANRMSILAELTRLRRFCCHPSLVLPGEGVPSAKMEALVELLDGLHEGHHRALVFSQFTDYLAIVRKVIEAHGWSHLYLDGSTPTSEREKRVNEFQSGTGDFFLISLKAGGTGLNLTAANYVILLDPWWNPAVENQAADRAHRIGQKNPVTVYRLIAQETVEARVIELHREKQEIAEDVLDGTGSSALSPAQLMRLFG